MGKHFLGRILKNCIGYKKNAIANLCFHMGEEFKRNTMGTVMEEGGMREESYSYLKNLCDETTSRCMNLVFLQKKTSLYWLNIEKTVSATTKTNTNTLAHFCPPMGEEFV